MNAIYENIKNLTFISECLEILNTLIKDYCDSHGVYDTIHYLLEMGIKKETICNLGFNMHDVEDVSERVYGDE